MGAALGRLQVIHVAAHDSIGAGEETARRTSRSSWRRQPSNFWPQSAGGGTSTGTSASRRRPWRTKSFSISTVVRVGGGGKHQGRVCGLVAGRDTSSVERWTAGHTCLPQHRSVCKVKSKTAFSVATARAGRVYPKRLPFVAPRFAACCGSGRVSSAVIEI